MTIFLKKNNFVIIVIFCYCLALLVFGESNQKIIVELSNGKVLGFTTKLENTGVGIKRRIPNADVFLGIPYAQPPIGKLRLEVHFKNLKNRKM